MGAKFRTAGASGKKVHVMSRKGYWVLFKEGSKRVISEFETKKSAISNGKKIVKSTASESLVIHKADGTVDKVQLAK
ncbi:MAG: DUF2188 domain-containing protein [Marinirhabdus sp.]